MNISRKPFPCLECNRSFGQAAALTAHRRAVHSVPDAAQTRVTPLCDYCGAKSEFVRGSDVYPHRPDLAAKPMYRCKPCKAHVGCHPGTVKPLGRLANAELRTAKQEAHAAFDPLWKAKLLEEGISQGEARGKAYAWLAGQLGIPEADCHIGMMTLDLCRRAVEICAPYLRMAA